MSRVNKIVALLITVISFTNEEAFAGRRDYDGFRSMHARRAFRLGYPCEPRRGVAISMHPGAVLGPVPLYARRACHPVLMRMGVSPVPVFAPPFCSPMRRMSVGISVPLFPRRVWGGPVVMRTACPPMLMRPRGFWYRAR